jgi:hypothetical protein
MWPDQSPQDYPMMNRQYGTIGASNIEETSVPTTSLYLITLGLKYQQITTNIAHRNDPLQHLPQHKPQLLVLYLLSVFSSQKFDHNSSLQIHINLRYKSPAPLQQTWNFNCNCANHWHHQHHHWCIINSNSIHTFFKGKKVMVISFGMTVIRPTKLSH